jgi:hypothetical protein
MTKSGAEQTALASSVAAQGVETALATRKRKRFLPTPGRSTVPLRWPVAAKELDTAAAVGVDGGHTTDSEPAAASWGEEQAAVIAATPRSSRHSCSHSVVLGLICI